MFPALAGVIRLISAPRIMETSVPRVSGGDPWRCHMHNCAESVFPALAGVIRNIASRTRSSLAASQHAPNSVPRVSGGDPNNVFFHTEVCACSPR